MSKAAKCKRCEEAEQATHDESNWLSACEAEKSGLSLAYRELLEDYRCTYRDWVDGMVLSSEWRKKWECERQRADGLQREVAKLKKRWAKKDKWADRSVSTTGKWEDGR